MILAILGPGTLGRSLARHAASRGIAVRLVGRDEGHARRALNGLAWAEAITVHGFGADAFVGVDAVLEALPEDPNAKAIAWRRIAPWLPEAALRLTGSSSLPVGDLDAASSLSGRLMAFHLFVPVGKMSLVELVAPATVPPADHARAVTLAEALGLKVIGVKDAPGYAAARMGLIQGLEAMRLLESGTASAEDLDALMVHGYGHPVGPLELSDRVGLDLRLAIATRLFAQTGESGFEPPLILQEKVASGDLGRKTGQGFFAWTKDGKRR